MKLGSSDISAVKIGSTDVNKIYIGSTEVWSAYTPLLDVYGGAAAAYSLRLLRTAYTGSAIRIRRASDNTETNIGFVNNELDTATLSTFCSGSDGFVTTWYDQSGNGNDATQTTASNQPKIYDSVSGVIEENGKAAVQFDGSNDFVGYAETTTTLTFSAFLIGKTNNASVEQNLYDYGITGSGGISTRTIHCAGIGNLGLSPQNSISVRSLLGSNNYTIGTTSTINQLLVSHFSDGSSVDGYLDSNQMLDSRSNRGTNSDYVSIGSRTDGAYSLNGIIQEIIFYTSDQSSNRSGIETNINDFYNIY